MNSEKAPLIPIISLWIIALAIAFAGIGSLPLRDFDESIVARVSYELSKKNGLDVLLPTLWGTPYLNKPPGLHWLIALSISFFHPEANSSAQTPTEFAIRFAPAFLSTLVVPFGSLLQWNLKKGDQLSSITTGAILLTLLPLARHGRLAMLDGTCLSAIALIWLLIAANDTSPNDRIRILGVGLISSCILMLKAPLIIPTLCAAGFPVLWGKEYRVWWKSTLSIWLLAGIAPGVTWHLWHGLQRGSGALWLWGGDGASRVLFDLGEGSDLGWKVPVIEILEGGWPWLVLWPIGIILAWRARDTRWGRWSLGTQLILALTILPLKTQLPWYSLPLWLPFSLICGPTLAALARKNYSKKYLEQKLLHQVPLFWIGLGTVLIIISLLSTVGLIQGMSPYKNIAMGCGSGWAIGGFLLNQSSKQTRRKGVWSLIAGNICALTLLMLSPMWLWELNENWPVQPIANLATKTKSSLVALEGHEERPSLNWYAGKQIRQLTENPKANWILTSKTQNLDKLLPNRTCAVQATDKQWSLLLCKIETR